MSPISSLLACLKLILCGFLNKLSSGCLKANFSAYKIFASQFFSLRILNHFFSVLWQKVLLKSLMKSNPISYINHVLFIKIIKGFLFFFKFLFLYYNIYFFGFGHCRFIFLGIWCAFSICGFKSLLSKKFFIEIQSLEFVQYLLT